MRTIGLIVGYAIALFLTGWLFLDVGFKSFKTKDRFSSRFFLKQDAAAPLEKILSDLIPKLLWAFATCPQRPIGVVRYPDFPHFNFSPNGD